MVVIVFMLTIHSLKDFIVMVSLIGQQVSVDIDYYILLALMIEFYLASHFIVPLLYSVVVLF